MIKACQLCAVSFDTDQRKQKFCSRVCSDAFLRPLRASVFDGRRGINPPRREQRPNWKGDDAKLNTKRRRAQHYHPLREFCDNCHVSKAKDRHHIDSDPGNNHESNIAHLCRRCHMMIDGRLAATLTRNKNYAEVTK